MVQGIPFIISAPSGTGKTTLVSALHHDVPKLAVAISHTTRPPRPQEVSGIHYHFVSDDAFLTMQSQDGFLESAKVFGYWYGTARASVEVPTAQGMDVILVIDWQGAQQVRQRMPETVSIFIVPPSLASLQERMVSRQQDDAEVMLERLVKASGEISHYGEYDYVVVNDHFETAVADLQAIMHAEHLKRHRQARAQAALLSDLQTPYVFSAS